MKSDLHNHTVYSGDALTTPKFFIRAAKQKGLNAIALTDHNTIKGWQAVSVEAKKQAFSLILGEEIKVYYQEKRAGEILGLFLNEKVFPAPTGEVLDQIHEQSGLAIIAHPFAWKRNPFLQLKEFARKADAIEVLNARCMLASRNAKAKAFVKKNNLVGVGGSDSHTPNEIGSAYIESNATSLEELRKTIKKGQVLVKGKRSSVLVHAFSTIAKSKWLRNYFSK